MKQKIYLSGVIGLLVFLLAACTGAASPTARTDLQPQAEAALRDFFSSLNKGDYAGAEAVYGGSYEVLAADNPELDAADHVALFTNACTINGFQCLQVKEVSPEPQNSTNEFVFTVTFQKDDGSLFVQGPCCGASETESPSRSEFTYTVRQNEEGKFVVLELPPYVP